MGTFVERLVSFHYDYEQNLWTQKDFLTQEIHHLFKKSYFLNIFGLLYFLRPNVGTYTYDIKKQEWQISSPIIDDKILEESEKLSIVRLS